MGEGRTQDGVLKTASLMCFVNTFVDVKGGWENRVIPRVGRNEGGGVCVWRDGESRNEREVEGQNSKKLLK